MRIQYFFCKYEISYGFDMEEKATANIHLHVTLLFIDPIHIQIDLEVIIGNIHHTRVLALFS